MIDAVAHWLIGGLIVLGCVFLTVGTIGLLRFDTVYNRMHATSKPTTLGVAAIFLASFVHFGPGGAGPPSLLAIVFLFLTIPTGTHMIARAAERMGVPFREGVTWPEPPGGDPTSDEAGRERPRTDADGERAGAVDERPSDAGDEWPSDAGDDGRS